MRKVFSASMATAVALGLTLAAVGPASASITSPASGATLRGNVTFSDSGVGDGTGCLNSTSPNVKFSLINSSNVTVWSQTISATGAVTSQTVVTQSYPNGAYTLRADEQKRSGFLYCTNSTTTVTQPVTISNISSIVLTSPSIGAQNTAVPVSAKLTDPNLGSQVLAGQTVTFSITGGGSVSAVTNASGVASASLPLGNPPRGASVTASFAGTAFYVASSNSAPITVDKDATATTLDSPDAVVHGQGTSFTAHVVSTDGGGVPTGMIQFAVDGTNFGAPVAVDGSGNATSSVKSSLSTAAHTITATYSGDSNYKSSASAGKTQQVNKAGTTTSLTDSQNPSTHGQSVTFTASISVVSPGAGSPTGAVQFNLDGQPYGTAVPLSGNQATLTISNLHAGNHVVDATYNGDADFAASSSASVTHGVDKADTNVTLATSDASAVSGEPLTYTAKVTPVAPGAGTPTGTVQFYADGNPIGSPVTIDAGGNATSDITQLLVGNHTITANYSGDGDFSGGSANYTQAVAAAQATLKLTTSPNPSVFGQSVTFHADVAALAPATGHPTGAVKFKVDGQTYYVDLSNGSAEMTTTDLAVGTHTVTATYLSDDANFIAGANDQQAQTVNKAATKTTVTTSGSPSVFGQPVTLTAQVGVVAPGAGNPSGTITFTDGSTVLGTVNVDSSTGEQASITVSNLGVATHAITATFSGDDSFNGSNGVVAQTVQRGHTSTLVTSSANPAQSGQRVTFTATISPVAPAAGTPTGTVTFTVNGAPLGQPVQVINGQATSSGFASLSPGTYAVAATYSGDSNFTGSNGGVDQGNGQAVSQGATSMTVASDGSPAAYAAPVTFTATVNATAPATGNPSGVVQFWEGGTLLGSSNLAAAGDTSATATFVSSTLNPGAHSITATYLGNFNFTGATASVSQVVGAAGTVTGVTALINPVTFGDSVELHATVSSALPSTLTPGGSVVFKTGST
ncbi:MAG: beta strand repeat-containing protein, partial [Marmoricola sp.]